MAPSRTVSAEEVSVDARLDGMHTGHHGNPGRMASRSGTVGVGKGDRLLRETVEVGRDDSGVLGERRDVVVEIVD